MFAQRPISYTSNMYKQNCNFPLKIMDRACHFIAVVTTIYLVTECQIYSRLCNFHFPTTKSFIVYEDNGLHFMILLNFFFCRHFLLLLLLLIVVFAAQRWWFRLITSLILQMGNYFRGSFILQCPPLNLHIEGVICEQPPKRKEKTIYGFTNLG